MAESIPDTTTWIERLSSCPICTDHFDQPKALPCLHTFCLRCVTDLCKDKPIAAPIPCPLCRKTFQVPERGVNEMPDNFLIKEYRDILRRCHGRDLQLEELVRTMQDDYEKQLQDTRAQHRAELKKMLADHKQQLDNIERKCKDMLENEERTSAEQLKKTVLDVGKQWSCKLHEEEKKNAKRLQSLEESLKKSYENELLNLENLHSNELLVWKAQTEQLRGECCSYKQKVEEIAANMRDELAQHERVLSNEIGKYCNFLRLGEINKETEMCKLNDKIADLTIASERNIDKAKFRVALNSTCRSTYFLGTVASSRPVGGIAVLEDELFVCSTECDFFEVYNAVNLNLKRRRTVKSLNGAHDMTVCRRYRCVYIADVSDKFVHRVNVPSSTDESGDGEENGIEHWPIEACCPGGLSATPSGNLLITLRRRPLVCEYSTDGVLIREITIPRNDLGIPTFVTQLTADQFCAIFEARQLDNIDSSTVGVVNEHGELLRSYSGFVRTWWLSRNPDRYVHAVADGMILVVDAGNGRVLMMDPELRLCVARVLIGGLKDPRRIAFDADRGKVYVVTGEDYTNSAISVHQLM